MNAERERIIVLLKAALERGYTPEQLREWVLGAVEFNEGEK